MTDKEAHELLIKYSGGEKGLAMVREMISIAGVDTAVKNTIISAEKSGKQLPEDFKYWIKQAYEYVNQQMQMPLN